MNARTPKIAVIGCGYWGKNLVRKFAELGVLSAICDANPEQAQKMSDLHGNPSIKTMDEIANSPEIDGIAIASPAVFHTEHATKFLNANKHVFVEKPLALNMKDAQQLTSLANEKKRILMVGHILQYHPVFIKLKEMVNEGHIGKLQYVYSHRLNVGKVRTEENVLWSFAPHDLTMILGLVQNPVDKVFATGANCLDPSNSDIVNVHIDFDNKVKAHVFVSWLNPFKEQKFVAVGDKAMIVFDDTLEWEKKLQVYNHDVRIEAGVPIVNKADPVSISVVQEEPLKNECQHFIDCILNDRQPLTDANESLEVLNVLSQAQSSLESYADDRKLLQA